MASEEGWVGIADVAARLSGAKDTIYRWVETKDFPAHRAGRLLRFRLSEVDGRVEAGGGSGPEKRTTSLSSLVGQEKSK